MCEKGLRCYGGREGWQSQGLWKAGKVRGYGWLYLLRTLTASDWLAGKVKGYGWLYLP